MQISISSNHFSHDQQVQDAVSWLKDGEYYLDFHLEFPAFSGLVWRGAWVDTEVSNVDPDYMSWVTDWLEAHTPIYWEDGEPWIFEEERAYTAGTHNLSSRAPFPP